MTANNNIEDLRRIFSKVGKKYGYDKVDAEFVAYRDFKVRWTRSYKWIDFQISDYLESAPEKVYEQLADTLFKRISGAFGEQGYPKEMNDYITSDEFRNKYQSVYVRRSRNIKRTAEGEHKDLNESLARLKEDGLVDEDFSPYISWSKEDISGKTGFISTLFNVFVISSVFDSDYFSDDILDYVVYHQYNVIREGLASFGLGDKIDIVEEDRKFKGWKEAEDTIRRLGLFL